MKRKELEADIQTVEEKIKQYEQTLSKMRQQLIILTEQEIERKHYISSSEIVELIDKNIGKKVNMSTIKRWADEGYLGEVIDEKDRFWELRSKQGKKRFLYPIVNTYHFLFEKGYLFPKYEVLDRVQIKQPNKEPLTGIIVDSSLKQAHFYYSIQVEGSYDLQTLIKEKYLEKKK